MDQRSDRVDDVGAEQATAADDTSPSRSGSSDEVAEAISLFGVVHAVASSTRGYVSAAIDLIAAEIRLAGVSGVLMLAAALGIVVFGTSFWLAGATALAVLLAVGAMTWVWALVGVSLVSAFAAGLALWYIIRASRHLTLPLTRQLLAAQPAADEGQEAAATNGKTGAELAARERKAA